jgi:hypothetical protein
MTVNAIRQAQVYVDDRPERIKLLTDFGVYSAKRLECYFPLVYCSTTVLTLSETYSEYAKRHGDEYQLADLAEEYSLQ